MTEIMSALPNPAQLAFAFVAALFPLVLAHEFGHFLLAKLNKVGVDEFGFGFPPRLFRIATIGETEYTVNALPVGGFVHMVGEDDPEVPGAFAGRSKAARTAILLAGPGANLVVAALILGGMALTGPVPELLPAGIDGVSILEVGEGTPAEAAGLQEWDIVVATDGVPLGERELSRSPSQGETQATIALQEATDASTGKPMSMTVLRGVRRRSVGSLPDGVRTATSDLPGVSGLRVVSAPEGSSVQEGDVLLQGAEGAEETSDTPDTSSRNESPLASLVPEGATAWLHRLMGAEPPTPPTVLTGAELVELSVIPKPNADNVGQMGVTITQPVVLAHLGIPAALWHGVESTSLMTRAMIGALVEMVRREREADLRGPLGIADLSREAGTRGTDVFLQLMAILSINLAIINLLPIPALDGGRLLFIAAEAIRGRRVEPSREAVVHLIGFALVIGLMGVLTVYDAIRLWLQ